MLAGKQLADHRRSKIWQGNMQESHHFFSTIQKTSILANFSRFPKCSSWATIECIYVTICPSSNLDFTFLQILNQHVKKYLFKNCVPSFIQFNKIQLISQFLFNQGHGLFNILHWLGVCYSFRFGFNTQQCHTRSIIFFLTQILKLSFSIQNIEVYKLAVFFWIKNR